MQFLTGFNQGLYPLFDSLLDALFNPFFDTLLNPLFNPYFFPFCQFICKQFLSCFAPPPALLVLFLIGPDYDVHHRLIKRVILIVLIFPGKRLDIQLKVQPFPEPAKPGVLLFWQLPLWTFLTLTPYRFFRCRTRRPG